MPLLADAAADRVACRIGTAVLTQEWQQVLRVFMEPSPHLGYRRWRLVRHRCQLSAIRHSPGRVV